jgi:hypothetical protein
MRRVTGLLVLGCVLPLIAETAGAAGAGPSCRNLVNERGQITVICDDVGGGPGPGSGGGPQGPTEPTVPVVSSGQDNGNACIAVAYVPVSQAYGGGMTEDQVLAITEQTAAGMIDLGMGYCPGSAAPTVTPAMWAMSYVRSIPLPVPAPEIDPGTMLVGLEAFLETGASITYEVAEPGTPFGPATFTFTSVLTVDWGDGTTTGPVAAAGGPYPDGDLRHVYTRQGSYDIVVTQDWVATWQIGAESGTIDGLQTTGTLAGFPVEEREAVVVG